MSYHKFTVELVCDVCGLPTSDTLTLDTFFWDEETGTKKDDGKHWSENYADHRHTQCEIDHGSFKEMVDEYRLKVKDDGLEAEEFVKQNRKKGDFNRELDKKIIKDEETVL